VLSQKILYHQIYIRQSNRALFDKAGYHLQMDNYGFIKALLGRYLALAFTVAVNCLLFFFPLGSLIIFTASFCAVCSTMGLATAKRAIDVIA
jgi:hypothetical protein